MKFEEVLSALRQGKMLTREAWESMLFIQIIISVGRKDLMMLFTETQEYKLYSIDLEDINAEDWEVVE